MMEEPQGLQRLQLYRGLFCFSLVFLMDTEGRFIKHGEEGTHYKLYFLMLAVVIRTSR